MIITTSIGKAHETSEKGNGDNGFEQLIETTSTRELDTSLFKRSLVTEEYNVDTIQNRLYKGEQSCHS